MENVFFVYRNGYENQHLQIPTHHPAQTQRTATGFIGRWLTFPVINYGKGKLLLSTLELVPHRAVAFTDMCSCCLNSITNRTLMRQYWAIGELTLQRRNDENQQIFCFCVPPEFSHSWFAYAKITKLQGTTLQKMGRFSKFRHCKIYFYKFTISKFKNLPDLPMVVPKCLWKISLQNTD